MSYKGQLDAWGWDRAVEAIKAGIIKADTLEDIKTYGDKIAAMFYVADKDFVATVAEIGEMIKTCDDPLEKVNALMHELEFVKEQITAQSTIIQPIGKAN